MEDDVSGRVCRCADEKHFGVLHSVPVPLIAFPTDCVCPTGNMAKECLKKKTQNVHCVIILEKKARLDWIFFCHQKKFPGVDSCVTGK